MTDLMIQKKILKLCLQKGTTIDRITNDGINHKYFIDAETSKESKILSKIFKLICSYYDESGGCILTNDIFNEQIKELEDTKVKTEILTSWLEIKDQEATEDELHFLVGELKQRYASKILDSALSTMQDNLISTGLETSVSQMQSDLDRIHNILYTFDVDRTIFDLRDRAEKFSEEYKYRMNNPDKFTGIHSGIPDLDDRTFGWQPGQLIVFLASTGGGKSIQLLNCALNANRMQKKNVLYFSFEMSAWECELRTLANSFEISYKRIKSQTLSQIEQDALKEAYNEAFKDAYFEYDVNIDDPTPEYIESRYRELCATKGKPDIIIVDYIGNMHSRSSRKDARPWEKNGDAIAGLFKIAKKYQIPIVSAQQINRDAFRENRKKREEGKQTSFYQDAASGDQRLMHLAYYVIAIEADFKNKVVTYHDVKMRDAPFDPFIATLDPDIYKIFPMTESAQEHWKIIKGLIKPAEDTEAGTPRKNYTIEDVSDEEESVIPWG